jgi:predicted RND superfamily exporter protein
VAIGLWGLFVGEVNMGVAVIMTIANGIIVDDTIHLFSKFADGLRKGFDTDDAIRYSFSQAGKGVLITTVVLSAGFAMLMFSDFTVNHTLGIMVSGTIAIALLFDLLFLPSVLKIFPVNPQSFRRS